MSALLALVVIVASTLGGGLPPSEGVVTYYGPGFMGRNTAATWHGQRFAGIPAVVTADSYGAASNDHAFGTVLEVTPVATCWGEPLEIAPVRVVVVDRMAAWVEPGRVDLQPGAARAIGLERLGCIEATVRVVGREEAQ